MTRQSKKKDGNEPWWFIPAAAVIMIILVANLYRVGVSELENFSGRSQQSIQQKR